MYPLVRELNRARVTSWLGATNPELDPEDGQTDKVRPILTAAALGLAVALPGGLMLGGNGRPGFRRVLFVAPTGDDFAPGVSFDQTMAALVSNAKAGNFEVNLVVERRRA